MKSIIRFTSPLAIALLLTGVIAGLAEVRADTGKPPSKPNIILIFIDDMGWADFSCFGNKDASTPHIDALATEGIAFEQFYVNSPICSPSRVAISTGQYPQRWGITSYLSNRADNNKRGMVQWLDPKAPMLARSLKKAGYTTGHFGKWHMGGQRDVKEAPEITSYGFDEYLTNFEGIGAKLLPLITRKDGTVGRIWQHAEMLGEPVVWMQRSQITTGFADAAIAFINKAQQEGKPFYLNLWPDDVHGPFWPSHERLKKAGNYRELYLAVLEEMDTQFAQLFDRVKADPALKTNTIILICSDNGPSKGAGKAGPFKGFKTHLYEGGVRSPLIVWAPGFIDKQSLGSRNTESVLSAMDLVPSLLSLTGTAKEGKVHYDGENMKETLLGNATASRKAPLFFSRPPDRKSFYGFENLPDLAVRSGKWKLLCDYDGSRPQLYDLDTDPGEANNLSETHAEKTRQLTRQVTAWHQGIPTKKP